MKYMFKINLITAMCFLLCIGASLNRGDCATLDVGNTWEGTLANLLLQEDSSATRMKLSNLFSKFGVGSEKELRNQSAVSWKEVSNLNDICEMNGSGNIGGVRVYVNTIRQSSDFLDKGSSKSWNINKSNVSVIKLINSMCNLKSSFFCEVGVNFNSSADMAENSISDTIKDFLVSGCGKRLESVSGVLRDAIWALLSVGVHSEWSKLHMVYLGMVNKGKPSAEWGVAVSNAIDDELKANMIDNATINKNDLVIMVSEPQVVRGLFRNKINPRIMLWRVSFVLDVRLTEKELESAREMVRDGLESLKTLITATQKDKRYPSHVFCAAYGPLFNEGREII